MSESFSNEQFPTSISFGAIGGAGFSTNIIVVESGYEYRNQNWSQARGQWDVSHAIKTPTEADALIKFFRRHKGQAVGFRYKDWSDYQAVDQVLPYTGSGSLQLVKSYAATALNPWDADPTRRPITKPIASTVTFKKNGSTYTRFTVNALTGVVTLTPLWTTYLYGSAINIASISQANPGVVTTSTNHTLLDGDHVTLSNIFGMTQLNNQIVRVTVLSDTTFSIGVNTSAYSAFTYGTVQIPPIMPSLTTDYTLRVMATGHGLSVGNYITFGTIGGMPKLTGMRCAVSAVDNANRFRVNLLGLGLDVSTLGYFTSGNYSVYDVDPTSDVLTWSGEFDVPARFGIDQMKLSIDAPGVYTWGAIPIVEIRG
jgi:uncharacterized protein (TIGR02217 family)